MKKIANLVFTTLVLTISGCSPNSDSDKLDGAATPWFGSLSVNDHNYGAVTLRHDEMEFPYQSPVIIYRDNERASWKSDLVENAKAGRIDFGNTGPKMTGNQIVYVTGNDPEISILTWEIDQTKMEELGGLDEYLAFLLSKNQARVEKGARPDADSTVAPS